MKPWSLLLVGLLAACGPPVATEVRDTGSAAEVVDGPSFEELFAQSRYAEALERAEQDYGRAVCCEGGPSEDAVEHAARVVRVAVVLEEFDEAAQAQQRVVRTSEMVFGPFHERTREARERLRTLWRERNYRWLVRDGRRPEPRDPGFDRAALELGSRAEGEPVVALWDGLLELHGSERTWSDLRASLGPREALVTYLRYASQPGRTRSSAPKMRYRVLVATGDLEAPFSMDLETSLHIELNLKQYLDPGSVHSLSRGPDVIRRDAERELWRTLWQPVRARLGGRPHRFFVVLDAELRRLDFASLRDPSGRRLSEGDSTFEVLELEDDLPLR